jgi:hypothetical protein
LTDPYAGGSYRPSPLGNDLPGSDLKGLGNFPMHSVSRE